MRKYWYPTAIGDQTSVVIGGDLFHHIFQVCRQDEGSHFALLSPDGMLRVARVERVTKRDAHVTIIESKQAPPLRRPHIHLCMSLPKLPTMESVLEKAVEMGVAHVRPFISEFSFFRSENKVSDERVRRWEKIIVSATQQSGRGELMKLHAITSLEKLIDEIDRTPRSLCLFAYEGRSEEGIKAFLSGRTAGDSATARASGSTNTARASGSTYDEVFVIVGSEGGFSESEARMLSERGYKSVTLGDQVLRVETACMALVSILKYELDLMENNR